MLSPFLQFVLPSLYNKGITFFKNQNLHFSSKQGSDCIKGNKAIFSKFFFNLYFCGAKLDWKKKNQQSFRPNSDT